MSNNIVKNLISYSVRTNIEKHIKYKFENESARHLSKVKKKKIYEYYVCDYCKQEIKINGKEGGIVELPQTLTKTDNVLKLALHNRCLQPVIRQVGEMDMLEQNYNHIPRID